MKYPRTPHVHGSRRQPGDEDLDGVPLDSLQGGSVVVEEKVDGANAGICFDQEGQLWLQSRGHFLTGGPRERHFALFKSWAQAHRQSLFELLGSRYLMYGEWLYAKHTIFYDRLPHYFLEFDLWDRERRVFLDTPSRSRVLQGSPILSVPVLSQGPLSQPAQMVVESQFKSQDWLQSLRQQARSLNLDEPRVLRETDPSPLAEGLYLKVEEEGKVVARYKWVRASFLTAVVDSETHWLDRPILPNQLAPGVDLFAGRTG